MMGWQRCVLGIRCFFSESFFQFRSIHAKHSYCSFAYPSSSKGFHDISEEADGIYKRRNNFGSKFGKTSGESRLSGGKYSERNFDWKRQGNSYGNISKNERRDEEKKVLISQPDVSYTVPKDPYIEHPSVSQRTQEEIEKWMLTNKINVEGEHSPRPVYTFEEAGFPSTISEMLIKNFEKPTIIQSVSWPIALSHRDLISIAQTGSGKTLGFALPGILHSSKVHKTRKNGPSFTVLAPTRELAQQVEQVIRPYCIRMGLRSLCIFGGSNRNTQARSLEKNVDIIVATPGRLIDFLDEGIVRLDHCSYFVLDEADRMLDMGFEPQIRRIIERVECARQTLMFSATWPNEVQTLANDFLTQPVFVNIGSLKLSANPNIHQIIKVVDQHRKRIEFINLMDDLTEQEKVKILVFAETKRSVDLLTRTLRQDGWPALCLHGDKSQTERDFVLRDFRSGRIPILVATDVAARGLDVNDITHVINYDFPKDVEVYVHRIGRTARHERLGNAITFFTQDDVKKASDLINILERANQHVPGELKRMLSKRSGRNYTENSSGFPEIADRKRRQSSLKRGAGFNSYGSYSHFE